jgi:predicted RNA-binding Zn-ribbon protein involved in translation (DUF1610 family)
MGGFVDYHCPHCHYQESDIAVGTGRNPAPRLALFRCAKCKTVGSTWVGENAAPRCANCYEEGVGLLPDDATRIDCPRCGRSAAFTRKEGRWE